MICILRGCDVSYDANNVTVDILIEIDGTSNEFLTSNRIEKEKLHKLYEILGIELHIDDINTKNDYYKILIEEYFEMLVSIVMFINPELNVKFLNNYQIIPIESSAFTSESF